MRPPESNSLLRGLAANPAGEHPDLDLLTAFAEGSLLQREQETVMAHLAVCAECRQVLNLAAVQEEHLAELVTVSAARVTPSRAPGPRWGSWRPWGALAAALVLASLIAVRLAQRPARAPVSQATQMAELKAPPPVSAPAARAPVTQSQSQLRDKKAALAPKRSGQVTKDDLIGPVAEANQRQSTAATGKQAPGGQSLQFDQPLTQRMQQLGPSEAKSQAEAEREIESARRLDSEEKKNLPGSAYATASGGPTVAPNTPAPSPANSITAGALVKAQASTIVRPHWRINDQGHPERSFGNGGWEPVLANEPAKMDVVSVVNGEVWIGGENDRVYRSNDEGATWQLVNLPKKNGSGHVIGHIRFASPQSGTIEAADGTTWTTSDGGATWN